MKLKNYNIFNIDEIDIMDNLDKTKDINHLVEIDSDEI